MDSHGQNTPANMLNFTKRKDKVDYLKTFFPSKGKTGLEIGPNLAPMVTRNAGWQIKYLDMVGTEVLAERARQKGLNAAVVPTIDYVYNPTHLISETVGNETFDFVVSSHVIEHIPDLILHIQDIEKILNPGGVYCFIVPDMSLCFDAKKTPTSLGQLIEAFVNQHRQAPISAMIDEFKYGVKLNGQGAWTTQDKGVFSQKYDHTIGQIKKVLEQPDAAAHWHGHIWRFTVPSFASIYMDCQKLGLVNLKLLDIQATQKMDFLVVLQKTPFTRKPFSEEQLAELWNRDGAVTSGLL